MINYCIVCVEFGGAGANSFMMNKKKKFSDSWFAFWKWSLLRCRRRRVRFWILDCIGGILKFCFWAAWIEIGKEVYLWLEFG